MWKEDLSELVLGFKHPSWGYHHAMRVHAMSLELAYTANAAVDEESLFAAACLHDIGALEVYRAEKVDHAERSVELAPVILKGFGFPYERIPLVGSIIKGHMFYSKPEANPESVFFHDADVLDFMGVVGITRILSIVGIDDWTPDLHSAAALLKKFTEELPGTLQSSQARDIAAVRKGEMIQFMDTLSEQTFQMKHL